MSGPPPTGAQQVREVGAGLRVRRSAAGLTQIELAQRMQARGFAWHGSTVSKVESGDRSPSLRELCGLAHVLDVDVVALLYPIDHVRQAHDEAAAAGRRATGLLTQALDALAEQQQHWAVVDQARAARASALGLAVPGLPGPGRGRGR
jgi:transcriptional regulator with XRE-family HTH domain